MNSRKLLCQRSPQKIGLISAFCLFLLLDSVALASTPPNTTSRPSSKSIVAGAIRYTPPNPRSRPVGRTASGGSRGICSNATRQTPEKPSQTPATPQPALALLAPQGHIGQTSTPYPTFVWFVGDEQPPPIELKLFEYSEKGKGDLIETISVEGKAGGVMQQTLPKNKPGLTIGKTYVWQVKVICSRTNPARNFWMQTAIEVVDPSTDLKATLSKTKDPTKRAELYAEAGFWYEALAETLKGSDSNQFRQLLEDLVAMEEPPEKDLLEEVLKSDRVQ